MKLLTSFILLLYAAAFQFSLTAARSAGHGEEVAEQAGQAIDDNTKRVKLVRDASARVFVRRARVSVDPFPLLLRPY